MARVGTLTRSRGGALDRQAAELKRIERDLHDGAQARMVSLALSLGLAGDRLRISVSDNGIGGVDPSRGSGPRGIAERLEAVDGRLDVVSPAGGPTELTITIP
jgi:signal transduction histidine kinase